MNSTAVREIQIAHKAPTLTTPSCFTASPPAKSAFPVTNLSIISPTSRRSTIRPSTKPSTMSRRSASTHIRTCRRTTRLCPAAGRWAKATVPCWSQRENTLRPKSRSSASPSPGTLTTAYLTLKLFAPELNTTVVDFDKIIPAVAAGEFDAGLLIHEGQLTYGNDGLHKILDLGQWWRGRNRPSPAVGRQRHQAGFRARSHVDHEQCHP